MSYYVHELPGRLRIKIPCLKRNPKRAIEIRNLLRNISGIRSVSVNTVTGSVIVQFSPEVVKSHSILMLLSQEGCIDLSMAISTEKYMESALTKLGQSASKALLGLALDRALQGTPLAVVTAFI